MPFEVKGRTAGLKCVVCGRIVRGGGIQLKTCCVNKPVVFCSEKCRRVWESRWLKRQEQTVEKSSRRYVIP